MHSGYLNGTLAAGILDSLSDVSVHPYRGTNPETAIPEWDTLRSWIKAYAPTRPLPVRSGEWGYNTANASCIYGNKAPLEWHGKYVPRMLLSNLIAGVNGTIMYGRTTAQTQATASTTLVQCFAPTPVTRRRRSCPSPRTAPRSRCSTRWATPPRSTPASTRRCWPQATALRRRMYSSAAFRVGVLPRPATRSRRGRTSSRATRQRCRRAHAVRR
jgi:hypothetical protein